MQSNLIITWEHMTASEALERRIEREAAALEKTFGRIISCRVFVEGPSGKRRHGGQYGVRVKLELPGHGELVASRNPAQASEHEDAYVAVRDAFQALRRQLREHARKRRPASPRVDDRQHGVIARIENGYGFIAADDGREIYFHQNAVLDGEFDTLSKGAEVHFSEQDGDNGPQASSVRAYGAGGRKRARLTQAEGDAS